jgi:GTP-binding protein
VIIKSVEFAGAIARVGGAVPGDLRQIAFSGRSNVGKSSLINQLLRRTRKPIAKVSATPGKTQQINFFRVRAGADAGEDQEFYLVDLPGYGYARAPEAVRAYWKPLIERFLADNERLLGVVQLIDARHDLTAEDRRMVDYLASLGIPALFVLTKIDKLKKTARERQLARLTESLGADSEQVLPFSAVTGEGREPLLMSLDALLAEEGP